jgi:uncharacterized membrane protein
MSQLSRCATGGSARWDLGHWKHGAALAGPVGRRPAVVEVHKAASSAAPCYAVNTAGLLVCATGSGVRTRVCRVLALC